MMNKRGKLWFLWTFIAVFFIIIAIALIEPMKAFLTIAIGDLTCNTSTNRFIKPVCFVVKGGVVLFIGSYIAAIIEWAWRKSNE